MKILTECINLNTITNDSIVLDIETTGFSAVNNMITILGYIIYDTNRGNFYFYQYFAESKEDEKLLLMEFISKLNNNHSLLSFNGLRFDIPFIEKRMEYHDINFNLSDYTQIDLYLYLKNNKIFTNVQATTQKKLETFMGLKRPFTMDGKLAVEYYKEYLETKNEDIYQKLSLYNKLDVQYLAELFDIYHQIEKKKTLEISYEDTIFEVIIQCISKIKDKYLIELISNEYIFGYEALDIKNHFRLNAYKENIAIELHTITGLISENKEGVCFNTEDLSRDIHFDSFYNLKRNFCIIKDEERYYIDNIKKILTSIIKQTIENFKV